MARLTSLASRLESVANVAAADGETWAAAVRTLVSTHDAWLLAVEAGAVRHIVDDWRDVAGPEAAVVRDVFGARCEQADRGRRLVLALLAYGSAPAARASLAPLSPRPPALAEPATWDDARR